MKQLAALVILAIGLSAGVAGSNTVQQPQGVVITNCSVWINNRCVENPTPAQRDQARREAEETERRNTAERAERERVAAERQRRIDVEVARLGAHRRAEAERLLDMQDRAAAVRPRPRECERVQVNGQVDSTPPGASMLFLGHRDQAGASNTMLENASRACAYTGVAGARINTVSCSQDAGFHTCTASYTCNGLGWARCPYQQ